MNPRLLILTAGFGEGHNAAARALAAACDTRHGQGSALLVDAFALASPRLNALSRRGYLAMINRTPRLWSAIYAWIDRSKVLPRFLWMLRRELQVIDEIIQRENPAVICSTYPVYGFIIDQLRSDGRCRVPHFNVVTDSISINSLWWRPACDGWFLPNEDSAEVLRRVGIPAARLHVSGFPVTGFFAQHAGQLCAPDPAEGTAPRVLYIINSGTQHAETTARLLFAQTNWEITCAVGRDETLRHRLMRLASGRARPARILGWTDEIPRLLMTHHVIVSKAGGATTQEAIAARCPMIVNQIVPGQEEGNYELLRRHGIGALAETPAAVIQALHQAFANRGQVWKQWCDRLATLARPDAARGIVEHLLGRRDETLPAETHVPRGVEPVASR
ncbi:MAG: galactosyldiacylglycerol synthase [Opitutaceae bacterium]